MQIHYNFGVSGARGLFIEGRGSGLSPSRHPSLTGVARWGRISNLQSPISVVQRVGLGVNLACPSRIPEGSKEPVRQKTRIPPLPGLISPHCLGERTADFFPTGKPALSLKGISGFRPEAPSRGPAARKAEQIYRQAVRRGPPYRGTDSPYQRRFRLPLSRPF